MRDDPYDMTIMQKISAADQKQNKQDGSTVIAKTEV
jgi:hypothetical protein